MSEDRVVCPWCEGECMISAAYPNPSDTIDRQSKLIDELIEMAKQYANLSFALGGTNECNRANLLISKAQSHQTHKPNEGQ